MKVAIIHDWLTGMRGGEKCLEVFCEMFPDAHLYTLICKKNRLSSSIQKLDVYTSKLQLLPFVDKYYRYLLPVMPTAIEQFELKGYDLILSSSHCVAKGIKKDKGACHICYCHTPMRYIWDQSFLYFNKTNANLFTRSVFPLVKNYLQKWDVKSAENVDYFISNSQNVARRIKRVYHRESDVIYPPVDWEFFEISEKVDDYYLIVSAFAPYKRIDLAVKAFNRLGYPLKIIGSGQNEKQLRKIAGSNIEFLGQQGREEIKRYYSRCKSFIFPGEEDFGITPLEAMASGRPVTAFGKGGALETVIAFDRDSDNATGIFFQEQSVDALVQAVQDFEKIAHKFDSKKIREHAMKFDRKVFEKKIKEFIDGKMAK